jgi:RNA polymerase sigma-70 factor (ECF subfamily)
VRERAEAEDLTAEVFHQALANLPRFEWRGLPFTAWLFRIAANAIIDRAKRAARESGVEVGELPALTPNMEEIEERARAFRLVEQLPADQRRVMLLRFAEDRTTREIAVALARSEGAIKQLQFRGLQNLRAMLGTREVG